MHMCVSEGKKCNFFRRFFARAKWMIPKPTFSASFWLGHCIDYCNTNIKLLKFWILRERGTFISVIFIIQLCLYISITKEWYLITFFSVWYSKYSCSIFSLLWTNLFCDVKSPYSRVLNTRGSSWLRRLDFTKIW